MADLKDSWLSFSLRPYCLSFLRGFFVGCRTRTGTVTLEKIFVCRMQDWVAHLSCWLIPPTSLTVMPFLSIRDDVKQLIKLVRAWDCQSRGRRFVSVKPQKQKENSNLHRFELHWPSSKSTKLTVSSNKSNHQSIIHIMLQCVAVYDFISSCSCIAHLHKVCYDQILKIA